MILAALTALAFAPVQDRAISVEEFIKSFDTETVKHVASKEIGEYIIYVRAQQQSVETIKEKLAKAISATWRKTETGFRLERTQKQSHDLQELQTAALETQFLSLQTQLRQRLLQNSTPQERASSALKSLLAFQEKYRVSRPTAFQPETEMAIDWLLFALLSKVDAREISLLPMSNGITRSNKPAGEQKPLPAGSDHLITEYARDRREISDFSQTILDTTADGPMADWIKAQVERARQPRSLERVILVYFRASAIFSAGLYAFDEDGELFDSAAMWPASVKPSARISVPEGLTADLDELRHSLVTPPYGYSFLRDPKPHLLEKMIGVEPLFVTEPLFRAFAVAEEKPFIAVLDDRLLEALYSTAGPKKSVAAFVRLGEDQAALTRIQDDKWSILGPLYPLDSEQRRLDRAVLQRFLVAVKKAGYVTTEAHLNLFAGSPEGYHLMVTKLLEYIDKCGYVLVKEKDPYRAEAALVASEVLRLRGGFPRGAIEVPASSLSVSARASLWRWANRAVAGLESRPGYTHSQLERNANVALPNGIPATAIVRVVPSQSDAIGSKAPFPNTYSAEEFGYACASHNMPPAEALAGSYSMGRRRCLRVEALVSPSLMLSHEYFESPGEMKEMRGYASLPEDFRKRVEQSYEELRTIIGRGL